MIRPGTRYCSIAPAASSVERFPVPCPPEGDGTDEIEQCLTDLAVERNARVSTHNRARSDGLLCQNARKADPERRGQRRSQVCL